MAKHVSTEEPAESGPRTAPPALSALRRRTAGAPPSPLPSRLAVPEVSDLVIAACQHPWKTLSLSLVVATGCAMIAWSLVPALYEASSLVRVRRHEDFVFTAQQSRAENVEFVLAQKEMVVEPQVLSAALQRPEMAAAADVIPDHAPVDWLREHIRVENARASEVMNIAGVHPDPVVAQVLCNAVTATYLDEVTTRLRTVHQIKVAELERAARNADEVLNEKWLQLHAIADEVGSGDTQSLTVRDQIQLQAYREYAQQLRNIQLQGNGLESQLADEQQRAEQQQDLVDVTVEGLLRSHRDVVAARERLERVEATIREIKPLIPHQETPQMVRLMQEREAYAEELRSVSKAVEPLLRERALARVASSRQATTEQWKSQLELVRSEETFLRNTLAELESEIVRTGDDNGIRLEMVRHAIERQERLADGLWQSLEQLKIESQAPARVALIALAPLPKQSDRGRQIKAVGVASAIGAVLVIFGIGYVEWRSCRIRHMEDVTARAKLPAYGFHCAGFGLPLLARRRPTGRHLAGGAGEAASQLILHGEQDAGVLTIAVSSATDAEPRDIVALEMALVLAGFGRRTLLVDADLTGGALTRRVKATELAGLVDLPGASDACQYVYPTTHPLLDVVPAGVATRDVLRPVCHLLRELRDAISDNYDAIIINSPAMLSTAECVLIAAQADQTALVAVQGSSRWDQLAAARHRAEAAGLTVLGAVLHTGKPVAEAKQLRVAAGVTRSATHAQGSPPDSIDQLPGQTAGPDGDAEDRLKAEIEDLQTDLQRSGKEGPHPEPTSARTMSP